MCYSLWYNAPAMLQAGWLSVLFILMIPDNEIYLLIKYVKSILWRVAKRLSYIEDAWCLKVNIYVTVEAR